MDLNLKIRSDPCQTDVNSGSIRSTAAFGSLVYKLNFMKDKKLNIRRSTPLHSNVNKQMGLKYEQLYTTQLQIKQKLIVLDKSFIHKMTICYV